MTQWKYFPDTTPPRGLPLRLEVKEKDQNTGTPEPYFGKTLFQGFAVFDGQDFIPFGSFHRLPIFWDGRLNAFGHKDVTARYALWEKDYFDNTHDKDSAHVATVTREGVSVRIYICDESLCSADLWSFEAEQIGQAILNAAKDAKTFQKAQSECGRSQMQRLNCEIDGTQIIWGYKFYVNGKRYGVHFTTNDSFTTNKKIRTCVIVDGSGTPLFKRVTDDVSKVSQDYAALVLKTFLLSKIKEDEE